MKYKSGILFVLATTVISGFSIYYNKFGVAQVSDAFVYTTLKNMLVAVGLLAVLGLAMSWRELRQFTRRQWVSWFALGLVGGGIPFLLFFQGLAMASAPSAALIQKTLFIWVAILAVPFLGERLGLWQIGALAVLAAGQFLLAPPSGWGWGIGETLILIATLLWSVETIIAKKLLANVSAHTAAFGRMGVGVVVMWGFLAITGRAGSALALDGTQWFWVAISSVFLFGYVWTWYSALKRAPATLVTSVLTLAALITIALNNLEKGQLATLPQLAVFVMMTIAAGVFVYASLRHRQALPEAT